MLCVTLALPRGGYAAQLLTNGNFETGSFSGWTVGTTQSDPFEAALNDGLNSQVISSSPGQFAWFIRNVAANYFGSPNQALPITNYSAFNGFDGSPGFFYLRQTFSFTGTVVSGQLSFQYGVQSNYSGTARVFTANILNAAGTMQLANVFSYTRPTGNLPAWSTSPVSADVTAALNSLGAGTYQLEFRIDVPQSFTGPAQFAIDNIALNVTTKVCGNTVVEAGEQCDDGNTLNGDCCSSTCQFEAMGTVCRAAAGGCDVQEVCSGASAACPGDTRRPSGFVCNAGSGDLCDVDEVCDGSSAACPADIVAMAGTLCRAGSGDSCDPDETCTGAADAPCPPDIVTSNTTVCRPGSGDLCDPDELCPGMAGAPCPADVVLPSSTVCNPGSGDVCDPDEVCPGTAGGGCPADTFASSSTPCRPAADICDAAENCPGVPDAACPADAKVLSGTTCRAAAGDCDLTDTCDGSSDACPADAKQASGTGCDDHNTCTQTDQCDGAGLCVGSDLLDCDDDDACTADSCDPLNGCANDDAPAIGCLTSQKSILLIKNKDDDSKDKLLWKWIKGAALTQPQLADPTGSAGYALCVYAGTTNTLVADAALPSGSSWSALSDKGYKFNGTSPDGLMKALLKGGADGKSKALAKGKGTALPDPTLPLGYPVTVQLKKDGSPVCLESTFTSTNEVKNEAGLFKAKK